MLLLVAFFTFVFADLSGEYTGSKTIIGVKITQEMTFKEGGKVDFSFTGPLTINCPDEDYTMDSDGTITLTNLDTQGDCLEKNLADNDVTLKGITYSAGNDQIDLSFKWKFISESLDLHKATNSLTAPTVSQSTPLKKDVSFIEVPAITGEYSGTKSIIGVEITATITFGNNMEAEFSISGPLTIDCPNEPYTIASDGTISMVNINNKGDCLHDNMASNDVTLKGIKYSADSDTISVSVKYKFLSETLTLNKVNDAIVATALSGKYSGTKTIVGVEIIASVAFSSDMKVELTLSGPLTIDCADESYTMASDGTISMTNINVDGDCLHDNMASNDVTLKGIKYSSDSDTITVTVKYKFLTESLTLSKISKMIAVTDMTGEYSGTKTIIGVEITATITFEDGMKAEFAISGPLTIDCPDEPYTLASDGTMSMTNINNDGDCLHDNMASNDVTLKGMKYSSDSDTITVSVKWKFLTESLTLSKVSNALIAPPAPESIDNDLVTEVKAGKKIKILSNREYREIVNKNLLG